MTNLLRWNSRSSRYPSRTMQDYCLSSRTSLLSWGRTFSIEFTWKVEIIPVGLRMSWKNKPTQKFQTKYIWVSFDPSSLVKTDPLGFAVTPTRHIALLFIILHILLFFSRIFCWTHPAAHTNIPNPCKLYVQIGGGKKLMKTRVETNDARKMSELLFWLIKSTISQGLLPFFLCR